MAAFSLLELLFVLGFAVSLGGIAIPHVTLSLDDMRAAGATRYVAARLQQARTEAVTRSRDAAVRFTAVGSTVVYAVYVDGNRNGVLTNDIEDGIDYPIAPLERLTDHFPRVDFGVASGLPPVVPDDPPPGGDPIRLGAGNLATFTTAGTSSTGSVYIRGPGGAQFVIRLFGQTGKVRILRFNPRMQTWSPI
jgi:type II secretory pathway pseudopilin PulG